MNNKINNVLVKFSTTSQTFINDFWTVLCTNQTNLYHNMVYYVFIEQLNSWSQILNIELI